MASSRSAALSVLLVLACASAAIAAPKPWLCPPKGLDSMKGFNAGKFTAAPWFVYSQIPTADQPADQLFCAKLTVSYADLKNINKGFTVCNYANQGKVGGPSVGNCLAKTTLPALSALPWPWSRSDYDTVASKLLVLPTSKSVNASTDDLAKPPAFNQTRIATPFWVLAAGPSANATLGYDWVIVSAGIPSNATLNDKCLPPNGDPVWFLTRDAVPSKNITAALAAAANATRIDSAALKQVVHDKCTYA